MPTKSRNHRSPKRLARRMKTTRRLSRKKDSTRRASHTMMRGGATQRRRQPTQQELRTALEHLPPNVIREIGKYHRQLIPPFTNNTLCRAVLHYVAGGDRKKRIVQKYGEISNWDTSRVTNMEGMFQGARSFDQPLNDWNVSGRPRITSRPPDPLRRTRSAT